MMVYLKTSIENDDIKKHTYYLAEKRYSIKDKNLNGGKKSLHRRDAVHLTLATIFACIIIIGSITIGWPIILFLIPSLPPLALSVYISTKNVKRCGYSVGNRKSLRREGFVIGV